MTSLTITTARVLAGIVLLAAIRAPGASATTFFFARPRPFPAPQGSHRLPASPPSSLPRSPAWARTALRVPRGGGTQAACNSDRENSNEESDGDARSHATEESAWLLRQISLRSQRLAVLSSAVVEAGFALPQLQRKGKASKAKVGWDCVLAPEEEEEEEDEGDGAETLRPAVPCLIMGEVLPGCKAVAPAGSGRWVGLWELNKMRRLEPAKAVGLWYDAFELDWAAFGAAAGPLGVATGFLLDRRWGLRAALALCLAAALAVFQAPLAFLATRALTSEALWLRYLGWSRLLYAPLAAKLYFAGVSMRQSPHCPVPPALHCSFFQRYPLLPALSTALRAVLLPRSHPWAVSVQQRCCGATWCRSAGKPSRSACAAG